MFFLYVFPNYVVKCVRISDCYSLLEDYSFWQFKYFFILFNDFLLDFIFVWCQYCYAYFLFPFACCVVSHLWILKLCVSFYFRCIVHGKITRFYVIFNLNISLNRYIYIYYDFSLLMFFSITLSWFPLSRVVRMLEWSNFLCFVLCLLCWFE